MEMATALAELGVTAATLDAEATERLDRDGYAALPDVLSGEQVEAVRARLAELLAAEGAGGCDPEPIDADGRLGQFKLSVVVGGGMQDKSRVCGLKRNL